MNRTLLASVISMLMMGCAGVSPDDRSQEAVLIKRMSTAQRQPIVGLTHNQNRMWQAPNRRSGAASKNVNHYARGIMQDLLSNLQYVNAATPVAVADFVFLDSDYQASNLLGQQLAEAFSHEVHKLGIPVVDYKLTGHIRVSPTGSVALSKDYLELSDNIPIRYILTGTLLAHEQGVMVNARIVGVASKAIVASAQGVIPADATHAVMPITHNDGV